MKYSSGATGKNTTALRKGEGGQLNVRPKGERLGGTQYTPHQGATRGGAVVRRGTPRWTEEEVGDKGGGSKSKTMEYESR